MKNYIPYDLAANPYLTNPTLVVCLVVMVVFALLSAGIILTSIRLHHEINEADKTTHRLDDFFDTNRNQ